MSTHDVLVVGGIFREVLDADTNPRLRYGGSGLVASVAAARLGARVALGSYVGTEDAEAVRAELLLASVDDGWLAELPGASGTFLFPTATTPSAPWPQYRPAEAVPDTLPMLPPAKVIVVFGIPDFDPVQVGWLDRAPSASTLLWDRQGWLSRARDAAQAGRLPPRTKVYLANEQEALAESGSLSRDALVEAQPPAGFNASMIKAGAEGVTLVESIAEGTRRSFVPAFDIIPGSPIGSGDVFAGTVAAVLASGGDLDNAATVGCAVAAAALEAGSTLITPEHIARVQQLLVARGLVALSTEVVNRQR